jgi:hypothetical protein
MAFDGLDLNLGNLARLSPAKTRSISAENPTGGKGAGAMAEPLPDGPARELGRGWKCRPFIVIPAGETAVLAEIEGPGAIQSVWITGNLCRDLILRITWDGLDRPSVEVPLTDFFALPWAKQSVGTSGGPAMLVNSLPISVNPNRGCNCYWQMPFRKGCRMTLQNRSLTKGHVVYYQINYTLTDVPEDAAYFHAQFRRQNPLPYGEVFTILDGVRGSGHYVGTAMGWGINNNGWWGEGEIKFFLDGDGEYPTICGTGTEDYFGGAWDWEVDGEYIEYSTPFLGMHRVVRSDGCYNVQHRHAMYRWHVLDPIRFEQDLKVTIQALGWREGGRFYPGQHDIASVAYWYQTLPHAEFPALPDRDGVEII